MKIIPRTKKYICAVAGLAVIMAFVAAVYNPTPSRAQCELAPQITTQQGASQGAITGAVSSFLSAFQGYISAVTLPTQLVDLINKIQTFSNGLRSDMGDFWTEWRADMQDWTAQFSVGQIDQVRTMGTSRDMGRYNESRLNIEEGEVEAVEDVYTYTAESCVFDSVMPAYGRATHTARASRSAMSGSVSRGLSNVGGGSATQKIADDRVRYENLFCNASENGGNSLCAADAPRVDDDIEISSTIFGSDTLEITDAADRDADIATYETIVDNLLGRPKTSPYPESSLINGSARGDYLKRRSAIAKINLAAGMISAPIADRLPQGQNIPNWPAFRQASGVPLSEISDSPSRYELRQGWVEKVNSPEFFAGLTEDFSSELQKEVYLKALHLMMAHEDLEKVERLESMRGVKLGLFLEQEVGTADQE